MRIRTRDILEDGKKSAHCSEFSFFGEDFFKAAFMSSSTANICNHQMTVKEVVSLTTSTLRLFNFLRLCFAFHRHSGDRPLP